MRECGQNEAHDLRFGVRLPRARTRLAAALAGALIAIGSGSRALAAPPTDPDDLVLRFCRSARPGAAGDCNPGPVLHIPRRYLRYGSDQSHDVQPGDRSRVELTLHFPSFRAWGDFSVTQRWFASEHQVSIELGGLTSQTVQDLHAVDFLGDPKAVPAAPEFGLRHYQRQMWGLSDIYLPEGRNPVFRMQCPVPTSDRATLCVVQTFTDGGLWVTYRYPRVLLPHWADIQSRVLSLIHSFQRSRTEVKS